MVSFTTGQELCRYLVDIMVDGVVKGATSDIGRDVPDRDWAKRGSTELGRRVAFCWSDRTQRVGVHPQ